MVRDRGFEPLTPSVSRKCSTTELTAQSVLKDRRESLDFTGLSASFAEAQGQLFPNYLQAEKDPSQGQGQKSGRAVLADQHPSRWPGRRSPKTTPGWTGSRSQDPECAAMD